MTKTRTKVLRYLKDKVFPAYVPTKLGKAITSSMLDHPDDWFFEHYTVTHKPSGISIWLSNDIKDRKIYAAPVGISKEQANECLSYGDQACIDEVAKRLKRRTPEKDEVDEVVKLLSKSTTGKDQKP